MPFTSLLPFLVLLWRRHRGLLAGLFFGFVVPWFIFVRVAREVWEDQGLPGDRGILQFLHSHATPALDALAVGLSRAGGPVGASVLAAAVGVVLWLAGPRRALAFYCLSVLGAQLLNVCAKYLMVRIRPTLWVSLAPESSYSFPSGHSMAAAALAAALGFLLWRTRWRGLAVAAGIVWAVGMGWSRMYLGVHYPSDVLAGWVGSLGWVGGLHLLFSSYFRQFGLIWHEWETQLPHQQKRSVP